MAPNPPFLGLSAFPVTPLDPEVRVTPDHLQRLVSRLAETGVDSIGVLGSTGSYAYLSRTERARALSAAVDAAGDTPILAGIGALTTRDVLHHAEDATEAGASALLLAPMSYLPLTDDDVFTLFNDVACTTDLPICVYNNPGTTHFDVSEDLLTRLAAIPGVEAVKNPSAADVSGSMGRLRQAVPEDFSLGHSGDATITNALNSGSDAWYSVLAGTCPQICLRLWNARTDPATMDALNADLAPLWSLFTRYGGIRVVYEVANLLDLGPVALPKPLLPLSEEARADIAATLAAANITKETA